MSSGQSARDPDRRLLGIGLRLIAVLCLAIMFTMVKLAAARGVSLFESLFYRQLLALPLILGWIGLGPGFASLRTRRPAGHVGRTIVGMAGMTLNFWTFILLPLAEATTIGFTVPIFATILSALLLREPTGWHRWGAVVLGFMGVLVVVQPGSGVLPLFGTGVGLSAAITVASVSILLRQLGRTEGVTTIVFWFTVLSLVPMAIAMPWFANPHDPATWTILALLGLSGGAAQLALTGSLRLAPVSVVLPMDYSNLLWATLFGWAVFGMLPTPSTWAGAPLIIASGLYIVYREHRLHRERAAVAVAVE